MSRPKIKKEYKLPINITVGIREGSGMVILPEDLVWVFKKAGYYAELLESDGKNLNLFVSPPRHIVTGEDVRLTKEEKER